MPANRAGVKCIGQYMAVAGIVAVEEIANEWCVDEYRVLRKATILPQVVHVTAMEMSDLRFVFCYRQAHDSFPAQISQKQPQYAKFRLNASCRCVAQALHEGSNHRFIEVRHSDVLIHHPP